MTGVGMGHAAEPLLEDLKSVDPGRHAEASVRAAEYFNSHPYLAGVALGALVRAEYDLVPGAQITRLRAALTSPLGALGDQLFWAGVVPAAMGLAILGVVGGVGLGAIITVLVLYNLLRIATGVWALKTGLAHGMKVGAAMGESWLPRSTRRPVCWLESRGSGGATRGRLAARARGIAGCGYYSADVAVGTGRFLEAGSPDHRGEVRTGRHRSRPHSRLGTAMIEREAKIVNPLGLHARPAAQIVKLASGFTADIELVKDGMSVNGKSIMGVMMLAAECGSSVIAAGRRARRSSERSTALQALVARGFGEIMSDDRLISGIGVSARAGAWPGGHRAAGRARRAQPVHRRMPRSRPRWPGCTRRSPAWSRPSSAARPGAGARRGEESHIFDAQIMMVAGRATSSTRSSSCIRDNGMSAETAYEFKALEVRNIWGASGSALLRERLADLSAIHNRMLHRLLGRGRDELWSLPDRRAGHHRGQGALARPDRPARPRARGRTGERGRHPDLPRGDPGPLAGDSGRDGRGRARWTGSSRAPLVLLDGQTGGDPAGARPGARLELARAQVTRRQKLELELEAAVTQAGDDPGRRAPSR